LANRGLPEIPAVDDNHFYGSEIEIIEQAGIHAYLGIVEVRFAGRPVGRFGEGAAAANPTEMMLYRPRTPAIGGKVGLGCQEREL
jgi:hypothetical protein